MVNISDENKNMDILDIAGNDLLSTEKMLKKKEKQKQLQKAKAKQKYSKDKEKYFNYYDDIKVGSHKIVDW